MAAAEVASPTDYLNCRLSLLEKEKKLIRFKDELSAERRALPLVEVTTDYKFVDADSGKQVSLSELFEGRSQLIVYHAMFDPGWEDACPSCTVLLDHIPRLDHLYARDVSLVVISRAKPETIKKYKEKMGFDRFRWLSSYENHFNFDYHVTLPNPDGSAGEYNFYSAQQLLDKGMPWFAKGEQPGHSIFAKGGSVADGGIGKGEAGKIYHTYSTYSRGGEAPIGTFHWLDMVPLGRQDRKLDNVTGLGFRRRGEYKDEEVNGKA